MEEAISSSNFCVSLKTDAALNGSLPLVAKEAPSIIAPGTSVMGSGDNIKTTPALRSVFETELGLATCFNPSFVAAFAMDPATVSRSFRTRVAELALDLRS